MMNVSAVTLNFSARPLPTFSCLLRKGNVQIPSDLHGVIYTDLDATRIHGALTAKRRGLADAISPSTAAWASHKSFRPKDGSGGLSPHCVVCYLTDAYGCLRGAGRHAAENRNAARDEKRPVVDDKTIRVFPDHRGLHAVVENSRGTPPIASSAAMRQRRTHCSFGEQ